MRSPFTGEPTHQLASCCAAVRHRYRCRRRVRLVAEGDGLENRCGARASPWVRIPHPPPRIPHPPPGGRACARLSSTSQADQRCSRSAKYPTRCRPPVRSSSRPSPLASTAPTWRSGRASTRRRRARRRTRGWSARAASLPSARGVTGWQLGDEVCALLAGGGYAEQVAVPAGQLLPIPAGVSLRDAAALPEAACTVHSNVVGYGRLARRRDAARARRRERHRHHGHPGRAGRSARGSRARPARPTSSPGAASSAPS